MKITASFEDGSLSICLLAETDGERAMVGAVLDQPQENCGYLDKSLMNATIRYTAHYSYKKVDSIKISLFRPNKEAA